MGDRNEIVRCETSAFAGRAANVPVRRLGEARRGWSISHPYPVELEPPFQAMFLFHFAPSGPIYDDARKANLL